MIAILAGLYPSLALSSFRPAAVLGGGGARSPGSALVRQALVVAQFAILIGLIVMSVTVYRQTRFALNDALRLDTGQVAFLHLDGKPSDTYLWLTGEAARMLRHEEPLTMTMPERTGPPGRPGTTERPSGAGGADPAKRPHP